jgi:hypothetical protein
MNRVRLQLLLPAALVLTAAAGSVGLTNLFVYDDIYLIPRNSYLANLSGLLDHVWGMRLAPEGGFTHFRPLVLASLWLNFQLGGAHEWPFRLTNLLIHMACGVAAYYVARMFLRLRYDDGVARAAATWAAGLFLLHPIAAIAVDFINKRSSTMATLAMFGGLLLWNRATRQVTPAQPGDRPTRVHKGAYLGAIACGALALGAKEEGFMMPALIALYEVARGRKLREYVRPFALLLVFPALYVWFRYPAGATVSSATSDRLAYLLSQPVAFARYAHMLVYPDAIAFAYDLVPRLSPLPWGRTFATVALALATLYLLWNRRRWPFLTWAVVWALLLLGPSSSVFATNTPIDEIRVYAAVLLLYARFGVTCTHMLDKLAKAREGKAWARYAPYAAYLGVCTLLAAATLQQHRLWGDALALFEHSVAWYPDSKIGTANLCEALVQRGEFERGVATCEHAVKVSPDDPLAWCSLIEGYAKMGQVQRADMVARYATHRLSGYVDLLMCDGHLAWFSDQFARAEHDYELVLMARPNDEAARVYLADVETDLGHVIRARQLVMSFTAPPHSEGNRAMLDRVVAKLATKP